MGNGGHDVSQFYYYSSSFYPHRRGITTSDNFYPHVSKLKGKWLKLECLNSITIYPTFSPMSQRWRGNGSKMKCPKIIAIHPNNSPTVAVLIQVIILPPCLKDEGEMSCTVMSKDYYYPPKQFPHCRGFIVNKFLFTILSKHVSNERGDSQDHFDVFLSF